MWDKGLNPEPNIEWSILGHAPAYKPGNKNCDLCLTEKAQIAKTSARKNISTREQKLPRNADTNRDISSSPPPEGRTRRLSRECQRGEGVHDSSPIRKYCCPATAVEARKYPHFPGSGITSSWRPVSVVHRALTKQVAETACQLILNQRGSYYKYLQN